MAGGRVNRIEDVQILQTCSRCAASAPAATPAASSLLPCRPRCRRHVHRHHAPTAAATAATSPKVNVGCLLLVGPRPHGALTLCVPLGFVLRV